MNGAGTPQPCTRYRLLGRSGLRVSGLCLGTMTFIGGSRWGAGASSWGSSREESERILDAFLDAGGNFVDTATYDASEEYVGEFLASRRDRVVIGTKCAGNNEPNDPNSSGSQRKSVIRSVERSLRRLKTEYIDLLWVHAWDFLTPPDEVMRSLDDLVRQGKVLYVGVANAPAWMVAHATTLADLRGWTPFVALQVEYSLLQRDVERELLPMAKALDLGVTAWTPLASGLLSGKYAADREPRRVNGDAEPRLLRDDPEPRRLDDPRMARFAPRTERSLAITDEVITIAREIGCAPAHVALNWLRRHDSIPIFGARTARQVEENMRCFEYALSDEQLRRLDEASKIKLGFPHDFLASGIVKSFVYGGMLSRIDNHRRHAVL